MAEEEKQLSAGEAKPVETAPESPAQPDSGETAQGDGGDEAKKIPMTSSVEDAGPCRKKVRIEIGADYVGTEIDKGLDELRTTVAIAGFRKGRIPRSLLVKRFGQRIQEDVRANLVSSSIKQLLEKEKMDVFELPEFDEESLGKIAIEAGKPLSFDFEVDVKPAIEVGDLDGIEAVRPKVEISENDVDLEIERLRTRRSKMVPVEGGTVTFNDSVIANREFVLDGGVVHSEENAFIPIPSENSPLHEKMPWVREFVGKKVGDCVEREYVFPDDFKVESARGKKGVVKAVIQDIKRLDMPEIDAGFLSELGVSDLDGLKKTIRERLGAMKSALADRKLEDDIVNRLLDRIRIELPSKIIDRSVEGYVKRYEERMREQGQPEEKIKSDLESVAARKRVEVEREFRTFLLLDEIARKEKIFVTEEEVDRRVEAIAANYGKWPSQMKEDLEDQGMISELRNQIREEKVKSLLRSKAKVSEGPPIERGGHAEGCDGDHEGPCGHDHD